MFHTTRPGDCARSPAAGTSRWQKSREIACITTEFIQYPDAPGHVDVAFLPFSRRDGNPVPSPSIPTPPAGNCWELNAMALPTILPDLPVIETDFARRFLRIVNGESTGFGALTGTFSPKRSWRMC